MSGPARDYLDQPFFLPARLRESALSALVAEAVSKGFETKGLGASWAEFIASENRRGPRRRAALYHYLCARLDLADFATLPPVNAMLIAGLDECRPAFARALGIGLCARAMPVVLTRTLMEEHIQRFGEFAVRAGLASRRFARSEIIGPLNPAFVEEQGMTILRSALAAQDELHRHWLDIFDESPVASCPAEHLELFAWVRGHWRA